MDPGDVLEGRWRLLEELRGDRSVQRWRAESLDDGAMVEILCLRGGISAEASHRFVSAHRAMRAIRDPGLIEIQGIIEDGPTAMVVRTGTGEFTLQDVRGPLSPAVVAAIAGLLLPAVLAAGGATSGALSDRDIALDHSGKPILAPRAVPPTRVARTLTRSAAPETYRGGAPDGAAGLYGLGTILYRLATGRDAFSRSTTSARPPPVGPAAVYPGVPDWLDGAILKLLSMEPSERAGALPDFLDNAGEIGDLREYISPLTGALKVSTQTAIARHGHPDRAPVASVLVPAADVRSLDPAMRSVLAGWAGLPLRVIDDLASAGLPVVIEQLGNRSAASERADEIRLETGLPAVSTSATAWAPWMFAGIAGASAILPLGIGAALIAGGLGAVAIGPLIVGAAIGGAGVIAARRATRQSRLYRASGRGAQAAREAMATRAETVLDATWSRLARLRQQLGKADLAEAVSTDLRSSLKDIERRVEGISTVLATVDRALGQVDLDRARTRLAAMDTAVGDIGERERLARTVADLEEVHSRRTALLADRARIDAALDEFAAVLGQLGSGDAAAEETPEKLDALTRAARMAAAAKAETE